MYRVPVLEKFAWQEPVENQVNEPATGELKGHRYLVGSGATGTFAGHAHDVAWFNGTSWQFDTPAAGWRVFNKNNSKMYSFDADTTSWSDAVDVGALNLTGDITSTTAAIDWDLKDNDPSALSFDAPGKAGILNIDTTDAAEKVTMSGGLDVSGNVLILGDLTVQGGVTSVESTNLYIEDKIFTVNKGGTTAASLGAGIEIEGDSTSIVGYFKVSEASTADLVFKAPTGNVLTLDINADKTVTIAGSLSVEADSAINQDLTTDADVDFNSLDLVAGLTVGGTLDLNNNLDLSSTAVDILIPDNADAALEITAGGVAQLEIDTTDGAEVINIVRNLTVGNDLTVTGGNITLTGSNAIDGSAAGTLSFTDGTNSFTAANAKKSFDSRAYWDADLETIVFDSASLDAWV